MLKTLRYLIPMALLVLGGMTQAREAIRLPNAPAVSADGSRVAFEWNGDLWIAPVKGGLATPLTQHPGKDAEPRFSPDGKEIAFVSEREGSPQIYVMPASGGVARQLTHHTAGYSLQEWSQDGKSLLVVAARDHFWRHAERLVRIARTERPAEEVLFDDYANDGTLSPDGKRVLFTREGEPWWRKDYTGSQSSQIWMLDLSTGKFSKILAGERSFRSPMWKPEGKGFYFVESKLGSNSISEYDLSANVAKELHRVPGELIVNPSISRDGSAIVYRQLFDLYRFNPQSKDAPTKIELFHDTDRQTSKKQRRTLTSATEANFTQDGLEIVFVAGGDLWVMDTELREAKQITFTGEEERDPVFTAEMDAILFVTDVGGKSDVWKAERTQSDRFFWQNSSFKLTRLTQQGDVTGGLRFTPDGTRIAYVRGRGDLWTAKADGTEAKLLLASWDTPEFDFSPDGKWLVYSRNDNDFNRDVWIQPVDGSRPPYNLSRHPHNEGRPVWSPDGKLIAFAGRRANNGEDPVITVIYLKAEDREVTPRDRTLEKALEKMNRARKKPQRPTQPGAEAAKSAPAPLAIDWDGLHERTRTVALGKDGSFSTLFWSWDSKKLVFTGSYANQPGTYAIEMGDTLTPRSLSSSVGSNPQWLKSNQIVWLANGVPASISGSGGVSAPSAPTLPLPGLPTRLPPGTRPRSGGSTPAEAAPTTGGTTYTFSVTQEVDLSQKYAATFNQCWQTMRDNWYDDRLGNRDWDAVRQKYLPAASEATDVESLATVVNLMLGELNGSHLGFYPAGSSRAARYLRGTETEERQPPVSTAHLGVRFDASHAGPGLRIRDVLPNGPADQKRSLLLSGEIITHIDGQAVAPKQDLTRVLNGSLSRDIMLKVKDKGGKERDVTLRPISYAQARTLLYQKWLKDNRHAVEKASGGKLGYLHINAMNMPSFSKFEEELYSIGAGKDGLVIDVRENGGGSTADLLLTSLTQPVHAISVPRGGGPGYPQDRKVYATWNKPIVVLCNQNSFSNAEIFSHAIKTLKRGQLVGVPTAGGVVSTGARSIMDMGVLRLPFRGWYLVNDGEDMELNGAVPHHVIWPMPGEMPAGKDAQLSKAVEVLTKDVDAWKKRPQPTLKRATERRPGPDAATQR